MAIAMMHQPTFLMMDEPTVGVDPQSRENIFDTIEKLRDQGTTILYTTHYMEEAERLCNHMISLFLVMPSSSHSSALMPLLPLSCKKRKTAHSVAC
jgi:ABC-type Mn2+/Zn2+ transport system ATPase subunit